VQEPIVAKASVVVLTMDRRQALEECVGAILDKTAAPFELHIVDNGSRDGSVEWLRNLHPADTNACVAYRLYALGENQGVCARNIALKAARGCFILQVDDDVIVGPGWDGALLAPLLQDEAVGAVGQQGFWLNWPGFQHPGRTLFLDKRFPQPGDFCDLVMGYCWAWRNERVPAYIGQAPDSLPADYPTVPRFLYDEAFNPHWHEETDLQLQIKAAGYRIRCGPPVSRHRSMKSWHAAHGNDPMVGLQHAVAHEHLLLQKWGGRRADLGLELDRRGLQ